MTELFIIPFTLDPKLNLLLLCIVFALLLIICFRLIVSEDLIESILLMSAFSLLVSICYLFMDAPDVAMTETALNSCLSTCFLLNLIKVLGNEKGNAPNQFRKFWSAIICIAFIAFLTFAGFNLPLYGEENTALQEHLSKYFLENTKNEIAIPSVVTAILASYRGYDTLGETSVILVAGLSVTLILSKRKR